MQKNAYQNLLCNSIAIKAEMQDSHAKKPPLSVKSTTISFVLSLYFVFFVFSYLYYENCVYTVDEFWYYNNTALCKKFRIKSRKQF